ncbi:MAG: hypothetical protein JRI97_11825, partial [Deltaproteobacteria bacterium]|nr:hypothetical protein [Deltaproteobacteria bacterium]
ALYSPAQKEHRDCHPLVFAVVVAENFVSAEFLLRTLNTMRCACMGYAGPEQARYIMDFLDNLLDELSITA